MKSSLARKPAKVRDENFSPARCPLSYLRFVTALLVCCGGRLADDTSAADAGIDIAPVPDAAPADQTTNHGCPPACVPVDSHQYGNQTCSIATHACGCIGFPNKGSNCYYLEMYQGPSSAVVCCK